ncbi:MAG: hypothetical protein NTU65_05430 [Cyanobacteria bacterium]|nr:hypothetical protein [Cyanobacteriota bacterium]
MALLHFPLALALPFNPASGPGVLAVRLPRPDRGLLLGPTQRLGRALALGACLLLASQAPALAGSALLDRVKQNPKVAAAICAELRSLNAQGITSTTPQAVNRIAAMQELNATDAEILTTYVVGLHCPDVR